MIIVMESCKEMLDFLSEAKEHAKSAMCLKEEYPTLASTYIELASQEIALAEKMHSSIVSTIEKLKNTKGLADDLIEFWKYQHNQFLDELEKIKFKIALYSKY